MIEPWRGRYWHREWHPSTKNPVIGVEPPSFTCPRCGATSYNLNDVRERYCGRCRRWAEDMNEPSRALTRGVRISKINELDHATRDSFVGRQQDTTG